MIQKKNDLEKKFIKDRINNVKKESINKELFYLLTNPNAFEYVSTLISKNIKKQKNINHSSILYALGITDDLPEREMEIKKISLPDVDIDTNDRKPLIEFWENKYGIDKVVQIKIYTYLKEKGSIFAALKHIYPEKKKAYIDSLNKKFEGDDLNEILEKAKQNNELKEIYKKLPNFNNVVKDLYKKPRTSSQHPAGVILSDKSLLSKTNLINENNFWHSASPFEILEINGLTKFDFLPLTTLNQIDICQKEINKADWHNIDFSLKDVLDSFLDAKTNYIFQFGSKLFKDYLKKLNSISSLEELAIICAILRRGPMQVGLHEKYLVNKIDDSYKKEDIFYKIKDIDNILKETHGVLVYQEQIMEILSDIANIDKVTTVKIIKILKNKDMKALLKYENLFIENVEKKYKLDKKIIKEIWDNLASFGEYGFPKSHAIAYTKIAYASMYYQIHYSKEWVLSLLKTESDQLSVFKYFKEIINFKISEEQIEPFIEDDKILVNNKVAGLTFESSDSLLDFTKANISKINIDSLIYHSFFNFFDRYKKKYILSFEKKESYPKKVFIKKVKKDNIEFDQYSLDGKSYFIFNEKIEMGERLLSDLNFHKYIMTKILLIKNKLNNMKVKKEDLDYINNLKENKYEFLKFIKTNDLENIDWIKILKNNLFPIDKEGVDIEINTFISNIEKKKGKKGEFLKLELYTGFNIINVNIFEDKDFNKFNVNEIVKIKLKSVKWNDIILWNYVS